MADKEYKTHQELLTILRNRGMSIEKSYDSQVIDILKKENYYNVVNGYKDLFIVSSSTSSSEQFKTGTTFDEVYALYNFDRDIRHIYLKYLLQIENTFKTVLAHEFSHLYGHDNYLKIENFFTTPSPDKKVLKRIANSNNLDITKDINKIQHLSSEENIKNVIKLIGDIQQEIARQMSKHHHAVTHYMSEYGYIPLWVLVNVLTFGKITTFYKLMKPSDKILISKFFNIDKDEFHKYMEMLGLARNKCAHDERFFDIRFKQRIHTKSISKFNNLNIQRAPDGSYIHGTNDAYAIAIIFALLLNKKDLSEFINFMKNSFFNLQKELHTITIDDVKEHMGFPSKWENLIRLK